MKKILLSFVAVATIALSSFGQAPEGFKYQAVVRDAGNTILNNQAVGMQMTIQQGSIGGTVVYQETFAPTTNAYGLVNLEIGSGSIVSGDFSTIDWSNGPYFIQTAIDVTGGSSYAVLGTSQLMSVPYALHSNTTDSIVGGISSQEADPIFNTSVAQSIASTDTAYWNNHTVDTNLDSADIANMGYVAGPNVDSADIAIMGYVAGPNVDSTDISNMGYVAGPHVDSADIANMGFVTGSNSYSIGDFAHGGVVFWVDETGQHGLVAAKSNQTPIVLWSAGTSTNTMAYGDGIYSGKSNTTLIIASQGYGNGNTYSARVCNELVVIENGIRYGDWYLPSKYELHLMYLNKAVINATSIANGGSITGNSQFQSSTESNIYFIWSPKFW